MALKAIIFDHDGVMVDTEPLQSEAWIKILEKYGKTPERYGNGLIHKVGITIDENWNILKLKYEITEDIKHLEEQRSNIYKDLLNRTHPITGLQELLTSLREEKKNKIIKMAIASSSNREYIEMVVNNFGISDDFDLIVSGKDVMLGKPAPDIYLTTAFLLNVDPENCIVLEDSRTGVEAAKAAGMKVIAIPNRYTDEQDFTNADLILPALNFVNLKIIYSL
jgi:HAD superfamily hydrolase (TIGR01509 family)